MKKSEAMKGIGVLAFGTFLAKLIGAFYRIPLTNVLGAGGMGLYQLVFPVYSFILTASSGVLPTAISILVSTGLARGEEAAVKRLLSSSMKFLLLVGAVGAALVVVLAYPLGLIQKNADVMFGYFTIAPAVFFVAGVSVLRGWYQGHGNMRPTATSNMIEAAVKLALGLSLAYALKGYGIRYAVMGALFGVTASEAVTFLALYVKYLKENGRPVSVGFREAKDDYRALWRIALPVTMGSLILPLTQFFDSIVVVNILAKLGNSVSVATANYGLFAGPVSTLINLPVVLGLALAVALVPGMAKNKEKRDLSAIRLKSETALKTALVIGVPFAILFLAAAEAIIRLLYPALAPLELATAANLLRIGSISVLALLFQQITASLMQGLGDTVRPVKHLGIAAAIKIGLDLALLPSLGIYGVQVASSIAFSFAAALNLYSYFNLQGKTDGLVKNSGVIMVAGVIMCSGVLAVSMLWRNRYAAIGACAVGFLLYGVALLLLGVLTKEELESLPFGSKIYRLSLALRFWDKKAKAQLASGKTDDDSVLHYDTAEFTEKSDKDNQSVDTHQPQQKQGENNVDDNIKA